MELIRVWIDAAYHPKLQTAGLALVYQKDNQQYHRKAHCQSIADNHLAELIACREALYYLSQQEGASHWTLWLQSDSQLVIHALERSYVKDKTYRQVLNEILDLSTKFQTIMPQWLSQKDNKYADQLAKQALHQSDLPSHFC